MKKNLVLILAMIIIAISSFVSPAFGQRSKVQSGDKSLAAVETSHKLMVSQIERYKKEIDILKRENEVILTKVTDSTSAPHLQAELQQNLKLISSYLQKINLLEEESDSFLINVATKGEYKMTDLRGRDPRAVAEAEMMLAYADKIRASSGQATEKKQSNDSSGIGKRILINNRGYCDVIVKITGPNHLSFECEMRGKEKKEIFLGEDLLPGTYEIKFIGPQESRIVRKQVGPLNRYENEGKQYALMATLLEY
jgi:hypothetical protein